MLVVVESWKSKIGTSNIYKIKKLELIMHLLKIGLEKLSKHIIRKLGVLN